MSRTEEYVQQLLLLLLKQEDYVTLQELSHSLECSKRSIQNYLSRAEAWLLECNLEKVQIGKKQGKGILLEAAEEERCRLTEIVTSRDFSLQDEDMDRRLMILRSLVLSKDELTIQFFADHFYVSRSVILADLKWVDDWLSFYNLNLFKVPHRGIGIKGSEADKRAAIVGFFTQQPGNFRQQGTTKNIRMTTEGLKKLREVYSRKEIEVVCKAVEAAEKEFDFFLDRESFTVLVMHITISVSRMRHGCSLEQEAFDLQEELPLAERNVANAIAKSLEDSFSVQVSGVERVAIGMHLMSFNTISEYTSEEAPFAEKIEMLAYLLMERLSELTGKEFLHDKMLYFGLVFHLKNSIYLLKSGIHDSEEEISNWTPEGKELYSCVCESREIYRNYVGVEPDARECVCLTLHFLEACGRMKASKRVLLVSNLDILKRRELKKTLEEMVPQLHVAEQCTTFQRSLCCEEFYDFIITMHPLEKAKRPVADLSCKERVEWEEYLKGFCELGDYGKGQSMQQ